MPVQLGGGLRTIEAVREALALGVTRVILGTAAYTDIDFLDEALAEHRERVVVSVDARQASWRRRAGPIRPRSRAEAVIETLGKRGVTASCTRASSATGCCPGPTSTEVGRIADVVRGTFVYSGGVSSVEDLRALAGLRQVNLAGVIVGKALYEGRLDVAEGQAALAGRDGWDPE